LRRDHAWDSGKLFAWGAFIWGEITQVSFTLWSSRGSLMLKGRERLLQLLWGLFTRLVS